MTRYTRNSRDRVFDAVDMISLVSARTDLRRAGVNSYFGLCPFHDERTASFHVRPDEKHYHCFGCQASGDPFTFVMETEGLDFKTALESLADRFDATLETEDEDPAAASRRERRERLYTLLSRAATYYARYLWESAEAERAREYLSGRGLSADVLREFRVGYAPSAWDRILRASRSAGFSQEELIEAGLVQPSRSSRGQVYDRFRERIMFPSADARGRVRGFGARAMRENQLPKYLNTSDSDIYHKRSQLFGIDLARSHAARAGRMILVEGYTDVLALHQGGMRNAVGIMGTALTEEQVRELGRVVRVLELCLDADSAGQDAMLRAARLAQGRNPPLELRVVPLPDGSDPAELVEREGAEALRSRVDESVPFVVFQADRILNRADTGSAEGRDQALLKLRPVLAELPPSVLRDELLRKVAGRLGLTDRQLTRLISSDAGGRHGADGAGAGPGQRHARDDDAEQSPASAASHPGGLSAGPGPGVRRTPALDQSLRPERAFLSMCIAVPDEGARALAEIDPDALLTSQVLRRAAHHLVAGHTRTPLADLPADDDELPAVLAHLVGLAGRVRDPTPARLAHARLLLELARVERELARARAEQTGGITVLAREREGVLAAIHGVVTRLEKAV